MTESPETPLSDPVPETPGEPAPDAPPAPDEGGDESPGEESGDE